MLDIVDKDFKATIINIFKEFKIIYIIHKYKQNFQKKNTIKKHGHNSSTEILITEIKS